MGGADGEEDDSDENLEVRKLLLPENNQTRGNIVFSILKPKQIEKRLTVFHEESRYTPEEDPEAHP